MNLNQLAEMILKNNMNFNNPILDNAVNMYRQNNAAGLEAMARNLCKERGIDVDQLRNKLGFK